jgi:hypothetical protein
MLRVVPGGNASMAGSPAASRPTTGSTAVSARSANQLPDLGKGSTTREPTAAGPLGDRRFFAEKGGHSSTRFTGCLSYRRSASPANTVWAITCTVPAQYIPGAGRRDGRD